MEMLPAFFAVAIRICFILVYFVNIEIILAELFLDVAGRRPDGRWFAGRAGQCRATIIPKAVFLFALAGEVL